MSAAEPESELDKILREAEELAAKMRGGGTTPAPVESSATTATNTVDRPSRYYAQEHETMDSNECTEMFTLNMSGSKGGVVNRLKLTGAAAGVLLDEGETPTNSVSSIITDTEISHHLQQYSLPHMMDTTATEDDDDHDANENDDHDGAEEDLDAMLLRAERMASIMRQGGTTAIDTTGTTNSGNLPLQAPPPPAPPAGPPMPPPGHLGPELTASSFEPPPPIAYQDSFGNDSKDSTPVRSNASFVEAALSTPMLPDTDEDESTADVSMDGMLRQAEVLSQSMSGSGVGQDPKRQDATTPVHRKEIPGADDVDSDDEVNERRVDLKPATPSSTRSETDLKLQEAQWLLQKMGLEETAAADEGGTGLPPLPPLPPPQQQQQPQNETPNMRMAKTLPSPRFSSGSLPPRPPSRGPTNTPPLPLSAVHHRNLLPTMSSVSDGGGIESVGTEAIQKSMEQANRAEEMTRLMQQTLSAFGGGDQQKLDPGIIASSGPERLGNTGAAALGTPTGSRPTTITMSHRTMSEADDASSLGSASAMSNQFRLNTNSTVANSALWSSSPIIHRRGIIGMTPPNGAPPEVAAVITGPPPFPPPESVDAAPQTGEAMDETYSQISESDLSTGGNPISPKPTYDTNPFLRSSSNRAATIPTAIHQPSLMIPSMPPPPPPPAPPSGAPPLPPYQLSSPMGGDYGGILDEESMRKLERQRRWETMGTLMEVDEELITAASDMSPSGATSKSSRSNRKIRFEKIASAKTGDEDFVPLKDFSRKKTKPTGSILKISSRHNPRLKLQQRQPVRIQQLLDEEAEEKPSSKRRGWVTIITALGMFLVLRFLFTPGTSSTNNDTTSVPVKEEQDQFENTPAVTEDVDLSSSVTVKEEYDQYEKTSSVAGDVHLSNDAAIGGSNVVERQDPIQEDGEVEEDLSVEGGAEHDVEDTDEISADETSGYSAEVSSLLERLRREEHDDEFVKEKDTGASSSDTNESGDIPIGAGSLDDIVTDANDESVEGVEVAEVTNEAPVIKSDDDQAEQSFADNAVSEKLVDDSQEESEDQDSEAAEASLRIGENGLEGLSHDKLFDGASEFELVQKTSASKKESPDTAATSEIEIEEHEKPSDTPEGEGYASILWLEDDVVGDDQDDVSDVPVAIQGTDQSKSSEPFDRVEETVAVADDASQGSDSVEAKRQSDETESVDESKKESWNVHVEQEASVRISQSRDESGEEGEEGEDVLLQAHDAEEGDSDESVTETNYHDSSSAGERHVEVTNDEKETSESSNMESELEESERDMEVVDSRKGVADEVNYEAEKAETLGEKLVTEDSKVHPIERDEDLSINKDEEMRNTLSSEHHEMMEVVVVDEDVSLTTREEGGQPIEIELNVEKAVIHREHDREQVMSTLIDLEEVVALPIFHVIVKAMTRPIRALLRSIQNLIETQKQQQQQQQHQQAESLRAAS